MASATPEKPEVTSVRLLGGRPPRDEREPGRAVIEDLARAVLPAFTESFRRLGAADASPSPEDGGEIDARGEADAAGPSSLHVYRPGVTVRLVAIQ
jgi:hypothetical protein